MIDLQKYSLRQHDLDQVIRVERGTLLSVPHRGTPRSVVGCKYTRNSEVVNLKIVGVGSCPRLQFYYLNARAFATLLSFAARAGSARNREPGNRSAGG